MVTVEEYSRTVQVASYEVGANEKIKLSVLLRMAQETSEQHLGELGKMCIRDRNYNCYILI